MYDEADTARVALVEGVVQTLTGGRRHLWREHGRHILQFRAALRKYNDLRIFMRHAHDITADNRVPKRMSRTAPGAASVFQ
jgi:hypothetical protein